ncbi:Wzt carbohydrate-binding domain-containing protein, partial [bacterium]|nr:Wzt carbohydrate-binding domain-containing protein [bacterium]
PQVTTLDGERVNLLIKQKEYMYTFNVNFTEDAYDVGGGMLLKTTSGFELGGATTSCEHMKIDHVAAGKIVCVHFQFKCLFHQGVYFLNAGVSGVVNGERVYLHRCTDAAMFKVKQDNFDRSSRGILDFSIKPLITIKE